jgi:hypothetical protein
MATLGPTGTTTDVSSFTNFASWAGTGTFGINTALTNFGWTRTADLNQIQWAAPPTAAPFSGAAGSTYPLTNQPANSYFINTRGNWVSGTNYAVGDVVFSSVTNTSYYTFLAINNSTTDPSADTTHFLVYHYELWQTNDSASFPQTAQTVSYVSSTQTLTVATNTTPNRLKAGFIVTISGATNFPQINGTWTVASATTTQLTFTIPNTLTGFTSNFGPSTDSYTVAYTFQRICMKLEYWGNTSPFSTAPWVRLSFGTGSDGLGNLTGNVVGSTNQFDARASVSNNGYIYLDLVSSQTAPSGAQTSSIWRCIASGSSGRFGTALWYNRNDTQAANTASQFWIVERAKDDNGNDIDDYFTYLAGVNGGGINAVFNNTNRFCQQRSILKWNPIVPISTVTVDSTNDLIVWYTSNTGFQFAVGGIVAFGGLSQAAFLNNQILTVTAVSLPLTSVANASGGSTVYTGTITGGATNAYLNQKVTVTGFTNSANNGTFTCTASTATTLTLSNAAGVAETHAATASGNFVIIPFTNAAYATSSDTGVLRQSISTTAFTPIAGTGLPCEMDSNICTVERALTSLTVNGLTPLLPVFPVPGFLGNPMTMAAAYSQGDAPVHDTTTTITLYGATRTYYFTHGTPTGSNTSTAGAPYNAFGDQSQTSVNAFVLRWD